MNRFLFDIAPLLLLTCSGGLLAAWVILAGRPDRRLEEGVVKSGTILALLLGLWVVGLLLEQRQLPVLNPGQIIAFLAVLIWIGHTFTQRRVRQRLLTLMPLGAVVLLLLAGIAAGLEPGSSIPDGLKGPRAAFHISLSLAGVAMLLGSGVFGAGQLVLHKQIKKRTFGTWFQHLPSLNDLDRLRRMTLVAGWLLVTISVGSAMAAFYLEPSGKGAMMSHLHPMLTLWVLITGLALADRRRWLGSQRLAQGSLILSALMVLLIVVSVVEIFTGRFA